MKLVHLSLPLGILLGIASAACKPPANSPSSSGSSSELRLATDDLMKMTRNLDVGVSAINAKDHESDLRRSGVWDQLNLDDFDEDHRVVFMLYHIDAEQADLNLVGGAPSAQYSRPTLIRKALPPPVSSVADSESRMRAVAQKLSYVTPSGIARGRLPQTNLPGLTDAESASWASGAHLSEIQFKRFIRGVGRLTPSQLEDFENRLLLRYDGCRECQVKAARVIQGLKNVERAATVAGDAVVIGGIATASATVPGVGIAIGTTNALAHGTASAILARKGHTTDAVYESFSTLEGVSNAVGIPSVVEAIAHTSAQVVASGAKTKTLVKATLDHTYFTPVVASLASSAAVSAFRTPGSVAFIAGYDDDDLKEAHTHAIATKSCPTCGDTVSQSASERAVSHVEVTGAAIRHAPTKAFVAAVFGAKSGVCRAAGRCTGSDAVSRALSAPSVE